MHSRPRLVAVGALFAAALLAAAPGAAAKNGSVTGSIGSKVPRGADASVVATSLADGSIAYAAPLSKGGAFKVSLPAGAYALSTIVVPSPGQGSVTTARFPVSLRSGQRRSKIKVKQKKLRSGSKAAAKGSRAYVQESGAVTKGVPAFTVENFTGATGEWQPFNRGLTSMLITDLVGKTPCETAVVANSSDRKFVEAELELQKSKYFDPKTRVKRNFILSDLTVNGTLSTAADGQNVAVRVTITDARTGAVVDTVSSTITSDQFIEGAEALAKAVGERVCRRPAAYKLALKVNGSGVFATHSGTGSLDAELTALRSGGDAGKPPTAWAGVSQLAWADVTFASNVPDCSYSSPVSPVIPWQATLAVVGDTQVKVDWEWVGNDMATGTVTCPSRSGPPAVVAGQPATALLGIGPLSATLPLGGGTIPLSGGFSGGSDGWTNNGTLVVSPIWANDAP